MKFIHIFYLLHSTLLFYYTMLIIFCQHNYVYIFLGSNPDICSSFLYKFFSWSVICWGTIILVWRISFPLPPFPSLYPFCSISIVSPVCIPLGIYTEILSSILFASTLAPKTASHGDMYISSYMSLPESLNLLSFSMFILIRRSPFLPPFFPSLPCPK